MFDDRKGIMIEIDCIRSKKSCDDREGVFDQEE